MIVLTGVVACVFPVMIIQGVFATKLPTRAQKVRLHEIFKLSEFRPPYLENFASQQIEDWKQISTSAPTVWEKSHNLLTPLFALVTGGE
jgi:hypothetical protein